MRTCRRRKFPSSSSRRSSHSSQRGASVIESCLAVALVGLAVFAATSTFGGTVSDKIVHGIVPGLGGPQNLQVADAGNVGGGDSDEPGTGSVGGGAGTPPDGSLIPGVSEEQLMIPIRAANSKLPNPVSAGSPRYRMSGPLAIY